MYHGDLRSECGLMERIKVCGGLYKYIINPSERITMTHIENHGLYHVLKDLHIAYCILHITKNIAMSIVKNNHAKFEEFASMFNDIIDMMKFNPNI